MKLLKIEEVCKLCRLNKCTIYILIKRGQFPAQIKITTKSSAWIESEVLSWIDEKINKRDSK